MSPRRPVGRELGQAWRYDALGYTFAFSVILWAGAGYLLDRWLGTRPILTIVGTLAGAAMAMLWVFLKVRKDELDWRREHGSGKPRGGHPEGRE